MSLACATCPVRDRAACSVLSDEERDTLSQRGRHRTLEPGEVLFRAGEKVTTCATLTRGALKVSATDAEGRERILALVHPAGFVGEFFQPFDDHEVVALAPSEVCVFAGEDIETAMSEHPALGRALLRRTQEDLHASRTLLALTGKPDAQARVAGLLFGFAKAASDSPCHPAQHFDLPLSRAECANMLGLTIETVSRKITALEKSGAIRRHGKRGIELVDPARLSLMAES
ncbi:MAG: transcriptional regulator [Citromicrobium sp.]|nr:transcriptional regulator [Citromicrobium sp.]MAO96304.1 transcriptional regulator [Citromicrobium sp.]MBT46812.1 transcriptional regulator [Citromicrobium sp.]|tara:strand:- start:1435 stop:2124 length:690 start_codon:yes stop_codon:yes gene_type:complete